MLKIQYTHLFMLTAERLVVRDCSELKRYLKGEVTSHANVTAALRNVLKEISKKLSLPGLSVYSHRMKSFIMGSAPRALKYQRLRFSTRPGIRFLRISGNNSLKNWPYLVVGQGVRSFVLVPSRITDNTLPMLEKFSRAAHLLEPLLSRYQEEFVRKQFQRDMEYVLKVGLILNSTLSRRTIMRRAMEYITELLNAEAGSLLLVDHEKGELYFEIALGDRGARVKEIRLKIGEGIAGWVAKSGKPTVVNDVERDKRWYRKADEKTKFRTRNILCVPVKVKTRVEGVLQALNKKTGDFNNYDLKIFQTFAAQVAIALENARLYEELKNTFIETAEALATSIEARDPYTGGHTKRVVHYSLAVGRELGLDEEELEQLEVAAVLHDIGKIGVDDAVLRKPGKLEPDELAQMRRHPEIGADILSKVEALKDIIPAVLHHQEAYNGSGYPMGLSNDDIPLFARIIAVVDTFDAMTTDRPYRKALPHEVALDELKRCSGSQFDPQVVDAFIRAYEKGMITGLKV